MVLKKLFGGLKKTRDTLVTGMRRILGRGRLDDATLDELEELLYTADLGPAASEVTDALRAANARGELSEPGAPERLVRQRLLAMMGNDAPPPALVQRPHVILVCGVNGSGKTTSIAKLAQLLRREGRTVMLAACDTFRAAAVEQLTIWAERLAVPLVKRPTGADPSGLAFDAAEAAATQGVDVLVVDTAGRLHTQANLMAELGKISRVLGKRIPGAPHEVLLVLDGTTGQNAIQQARQFKEAVAVTGLVVTKLDGTARGGAIVTIRRQLGLPVRFVGLGETADDLERFDPGAFLDALFQQA